MNYTFLRRGDHLPSVGILQKLLNRTGAELNADGIFGHHTYKAVLHFQKSQKLASDGIVGKDTWSQIAMDSDCLNILDCIDVFDPALYDPSNPGEEIEAADIREVGGKPILIGGMCNGVEQAVMEILRSAKLGKVFLLRFHGHGSPGTAGISQGEGGWYEFPEKKKEKDKKFHYVDGTKELAEINIKTVTKLSSILRRLRPIFGPYGCIQFMHCSTGRGPSGRSLLTKIASELNVPVSAAVRDQLGGGITTFRFEGKTYTAVPRGKSLQDWCNRLPDFIPMSTF